ncbi:MAG: type II 3-dehydroquinate dehydratase [Muribaculaceae bacterium]|nr:type II 3-dehydroquinate dehydratase [Muribaculaceae bacterium]
MIHVINGPNLNLLGKREPQIYGHLSLTDICDTLTEAFPDTNLQFYQSNHEGELIDYIQKAGFDPATEGIVINPGAYAHYSIALRDAIAAIPAPVIEVHISNIYAREDFRHNSVTAPATKAVITGLGAQGYAAAIQALINPLF